MKRELLAHYVDINMCRNMDSADTDYHLLGEGVNSLSEEFNPETETKQWINQANGNTDIKSYAPSISIDIEDCDQDDTELCKWINRLVDELPTGKSAVTSYLRVRLNEPVDENHPELVSAVKRLCSISVSSTGGDAGDNVVNSISIGGKGDGVRGYFDITTNVFTEGTYTPESSTGDEEPDAGVDDTETE